MEGCVGGIDLSSISLRGVRREKRSVFNFPLRHWEEEGERVDFQLLRPWGFDEERFALNIIMGFWKLGNWKGCEGGLIYQLDIMDLCRI